MRVFLTALAIGFIPLFSSAKPNFVLIFIDDMGYGDIGPFGSTLNRTPHLDQMAAEGMKLTSFYAAPVCSASRAQILTGSYAPRVSVPGVFFPAAKNGLNPAEHTVADYLREEGYATMCVGKWHLGDQREFLPTNNGFDGYFGIPYSNDMGRVSLEDGRKVHPLMRDTEVAELLEDEDQRRVTREYTEEAIRFIEANQEKPFFLYFPHTAMHVPLFPHPDFVGKSNNGTYGDWVEEVDWSVGQVLSTLKKLDLDEDTLVVFTSDNGPWASKGANGGVSGPLRGSKGGTLEGGVREPTIVRWPGKIEPGTTSDAISGTTDILPTFVSLAGGSLKEEIKIDGHDLSPLLLGETESSPHEAWYYYKGTKLLAVRSGPWKLALSPQSLGMGIKERPDDLLQPGLRLYNLDEEIGEITNVAEQHPDVVSRLQKLADKMIADIGDGKPGPGVRPAGLVENPITLYPAQPRNRSKPSKPIDWKKVKIGDDFSPASAPNIANKSFTISAKVSGENLNGVIVSHGGSQVGYSLYIKDSKLIFAVSNGGVQRLEQPINGSPLSIFSALTKEGTLFLKVNDSTPLQSQTSALIGRQPAENLCIGFDDENLVDPQSPRGLFNGGILKLSVGLNN